MVFGDQLFGGQRIVDALADLVGDELGVAGVGFWVDADVDEVAHPLAEAGRLVELLPEREALLFGHVAVLAHVGGVDEASWRPAAELEDLVVGGVDFGLGGVVDAVVVERRAPVGAALEDGQFADLIGDLRDHLDAGRAGADYGDALAGQVDGFVGPVVGVPGVALEAVDALDARHCGGGEHADCGEQEAAGEFAAVLQADRPEAGVFVERRALDLAAELHVAAQVELVDDVVEVAEGLGLAGEVLAPVPLVEQFL